MMNKKALDQITFGYAPNAWQTKYHTSTARHTLLVGGMGSGKTTAALQEHISLALEYPNSIWVVGRKTLPSLRITILKAFLEACPSELIREYNKAHLHVTLLNGSQFLFLPMDDPEKLKSLEIAGFILEEANEIPKDIWQRLKDRMRQRLPDGTRPRYKSTLMINPTDEDHWIPQIFMYEKPTGHEMFVSTTIDNMQNLPDDYVDELRKTYSDDVLQRFLYGQFGKVHKGRPVFPNFKRNIHVAQFDYDENLPLVRGWDFGYNHPVCSWLQMKNDQVRVLEVVMGDRIYLDDFINGRPTPEFKGTKRIEEQLFGPVRKYLDFCDPRGSDESDKGQTSVQVLNNNRIYPYYRRTWIEEGIEVMRLKMDTKDKGTGLPNFLVHPRCTKLIEALSGGYHREEDETPVKDGYYDNIVDGVRYPVIHMVQRARINLAMAKTDFNRAFVNPKTGRRMEYQ